MARVSIRDLFRVRHTIPSLLLPSNKNSPSSSSSSFPQIQRRPLTNYHPSIDLLGSCQSTRHLFQIQSQLITCGLFHFWSARLLKHLADLGNIDCSILVLRFVEDGKKTFSVNNVIRAYSSSPVPEQAVVFYFEMAKNGFFPNSYTFVWLMGSCARNGCVESGKMCHGQAVKNGVDSVLPVQNSLIHFYGSCGATELAKKAFDEMSQKDLVSWNSMVDAYTRVGEMGIAHGLFDVMRERNVVSWNVLISGYLKANNPGCVLLLFRRMVEGGVRGNDTTMVCLLSACGRSARINEGRSVHGFVIKMFSSVSVILCTSLVDMYSKCQKVQVARKIFDQAESRNLVCWNAMILGHCIHGNPEDGINLFVELVNLGDSGVEKPLVPDGITYVGVLCACARAGLLIEGRNFFNQMIEMHGVKPNFAHYWCLANLYAHVGLMEEAEYVLRNLREDVEDLSSESLVWANLLSLCRFQANVTLGERIADSLIHREPWNFSHYQFLLNVYAAAGQWDDVVRVKEMVKERGIGRNPGCNLVDLKNIVHDYKVGSYWPETTKEINVMSCETI
ncbi:hypothetical protein Tsubulata_027299 [Turnera subulata]|uniref:Pentacotripeptide-repeat region of PRORP domain-containing protein n=1 Tax=Turnera subulata TaxID=218843 RepID=A0A9Q0JIJ4_9ROSI|nr:hypothetical protein Tsubulata_027299 [Turnera subulata]